MEARLAALEAREKAANARVAALLAATVPSAGAARPAPAAQPVPPAPVPPASGSVLPRAADRSLLTAPALDAILTMLAAAPGPRQRTGWCQHTAKEKSDVT